MIKDFRKNSMGASPDYSPNERVYHAVVRKYGTVVEQVLHSDGLGNDHWGNTILTYDNDSVEIVVPTWQLSKVVL